MDELRGKLANSPSPFGGNQTKGLKPKQTKTDARSSQMGQPLTLKKPSKTVEEDA